MGCQPNSSTFPPFSPPSADELVRLLTHFPSAPRVLPKLKRLLTDGNSSMAEIVSFVRLDPGIAARVLQMGNSAYYGSGNVCFTVDEAVNRVGYNQIYELVSYAVASQVLVRPLAAYGLEADDLWKQSVACALAAEYLAELCGVDASIGYTVGLLHSVGMVAMDEWIFRNQPGRQFTSEGFPREAIKSECALFGFNQAEAGAALLRLWEFPAVMVEPVRWQYSPRVTIGHQQTACLLLAAKWLRTAICTPGSPPPPPDKQSLQILRIDAARLECCLPEVQERFGSVSSLLQVDPGEPTDVRFPGGVRSLTAGPRERRVAAA